MPKPSAPPRFSISLISFLCRSELTEEIIGNLHEFHHAQLLDDQQHYRHLSYWYQVLTYLRPSTLKSPISLSLPTSMFRFNLLIAIRSLLHHKVHSTLNLIGFVLGMTCAILLYFHTQAEWTVDDFHAHKDQIYRIIRQSEINGTPYDVGVTSAPFAPAIETDFPGQVHTAMRVAIRDRLVRVKDQVYQEDRFIYADPEFFEFFTFPLVIGDPSQVLNKPQQVVISQEIAYKYFGASNPVGELLEINNEVSYQVSGVMRPPPGKSHIKADFVASIEEYTQERWYTEWWWNNLLTYVRIETPEQASYVSAQFPAFMEKYFGEDFAARKNKIHLKLEPLASVYLNRETRYDPVRHGNRQAVIILTFAAIAILLIACFNYLNLSIATSLRRANEVGVRKVLGSSPFRLVLQFLGESALMTSTAILIAIFLSQLSVPWINSAFALDIHPDWYDMRLWAFFGIMFLCTLLLSGAYPALMLASFQPAKALKGKIFTFGKHVWIRKGLVISQFGISIFLISSTLLIFSQIRYLLNKDLGINSEAVVLIDLGNDEIREHAETFKTMLTELSQVQSVSGMTGHPGGFHDATTMQVPGREGPLVLRTVFTDYEYLETFALSLRAGRSFSRDRGTDMGRTALLNARALSDLGWTPQEALGKNVKLNMFDTLDRKIIGIVEDFHFTSLHDEIEPLIIALDDNPWLYAVKLRHQDLATQLPAIEQVWDQLSPNYPFAYEFLDSQLEELYADEQHQSSLFSTFAAVSILLACLGIFGLISHAVVERRKEFGIRKVLGANTHQIASLISRDFVYMIGIASVIAIPTSAFFIRHWLSEFAYRIDLSAHWHWFLAGGVIAFLVTALAVISQVFQASTEGPANNLRYE